MIFQRPQTAHHSAMFSGRGSGRWCCPLACLAPCSLAHLQKYYTKFFWGVLNISNKNACHHPRAASGPLVLCKQVILFISIKYLEVRPTIYRVAHQSVLSVVHFMRLYIRQCSEYHTGTQKRWCGCVKLWYCWVWSKSRWSNMIITMGCRLLNQHRPIMQPTELTGDGDSTILTQPNPKLTLKNSLKTSRFSNESNLYKQLFMENVWNWNIKFQLEWECRGRVGGDTGSIQTANTDVVLLPSIVTDDMNFLRYYEINVWECSTSWIVMYTSLPEL